MPSLNTYHLTYNRVISVRFQGKPFNIMVIQACAPTSKVQLCKQQGKLLITLYEVTPPDLERGVAPLGSPAAAAATPWTWGCSSWPPPLTSGMGQLILVAAPDLGHGVAPLGCVP